jgi:hypothetical protein
MTPRKDDPRRDVLFGVVERTQGPTILYIRNPDRPRPVKVTLAQNAEVSHEGPRGAVRSGLDSFHTGDEVIVTGRSSGDQFLAAVVEPCYRVVEASVTRRDGDRLRTEDGTVRFDAASKPQDGLGITAKPLGQIKTGDRIWATGWKDPADGDLVARAVGVEELHEPPGNPSIGDEAGSACRSF